MHSCGQTVLPDDLDTDAARRRFMEDGQRAMFRQDALDLQQQLFDQEVYRVGTTLPHARMTPEVAAMFDPGGSNWSRKGAGGCAHHGGQRYKHHDHGPVHAGGYQDPDLIHGRRPGPPVTTHAAPDAIQRQGGGPPGGGNGFGDIGRPDGGFVLGDPMPFVPNKDMFKPPEPLDPPIPLIPGDWMFKEPEPLVPPIPVIPGDWMFKPPEADPVWPLIPGPHYRPWPNSLFPPPFASWPIKCKEWEEPAGFWPNFFDNELLATCPAPAILTSP